METIQDNHSIKISVVIPAYNIEGYIQRAIDSVLAQRRPADEIIVIDDGSSDRTAEKIKAYGEKVRYIYQENRGLSGARNTGIREAGYDWIAFLDGDDEWLSDYLSMQATILEQHSDLKWSSGNFLCCLCEENRQGPYVDPNVLKKIMQGKDYFSNYFEAFLNKAGGCADTMVIHKHIFETIGLFNEKQAFAEDLELWWRIAFEFPEIGYVRTPGAVYHLQRPGTLTEEFKKNKLKVLVDLVEKNLKVAEQKNMRDMFAPLAGRLVSSWIRGMLFEDRPEEIRELLTRFDTFLSIRFKWVVRILMIAPKMTTRGCRIISKIVRRLKLRKKIVRPPS